MENQCEELFNFYWPKPITSFYQFNISKVPASQLLNIPKSEELVLPRNIYLITNPYQYNGNMSM